MDWGNKKQVLEAVRKDGKLLRYASKKLRGDKEVVLEAVKSDGWALEYASEELRRDREVVLEAVRQQGDALAYASKELKGDKEIVLEAVKQNPFALQYASEELKEDKDLIAVAEQETYGEFNKGKRKEASLEAEESSQSLEELSIERLELLLQSTTNENTRKKQELEDMRRRELIAKIIEAQEEGKTLDAQIREARAKLAQEK